MSTNVLRWVRRSPNSNNNFNLVLSNPQDLDSGRMKKILEGILNERRRGLTLHASAWREFQRWFDQPSTPLKSEAYVRLSNWFMTRSGDRNSMVASRCEEFWDALFPCRPLERLSSSEPGQNHVILPSEFASFWQRVLKAQGEDGRHADEMRELSNVKRPQTGYLAREGDADGTREESNVRPHRTSNVPEASDGSTTEKIRATFDKDGLHLEVEGSPGALADFIRTMNTSS